MVPPEEKGFGRRHFVIKYSIERKIYILKDLEEGTGTFIKINPKLTLRNNSIVSFGDIHFAVIFPPVDPILPEAKPSILVKFLEGPKAKEAM